MVFKRFRKSLGFALSTAALLTGGAQAASYCTAIYSVGDPTASGNSAIYVLNPTSGANYLQYTTPSTDANALALDVLSNRLYYIGRDNGNVYTYDVLTAAVTSTPLSYTVNGSTYNYYQNAQTFTNNYGSIVGGVVDASGTYWLYSSNGYIWKYNGSGTMTYQSKLTYGSGSTLNGTNGDMIIDSSGQAYIVAETPYGGYSNVPTLYKVNLSTGQMTSGVVLTSGGSFLTVGGQSNYTAITGLAINPISNTMYVTYSDQNGNPQYDAVNPSTGAMTTLAAYSGSSLLDLASCTQPPPAAPTITKSFSPANVTTLPATTQLTLTLTNPNSGPIYLYQALKDTLPSGMTLAATPGLSTTCTADTNNTVTGTAGGNSVSLNAGAQLNPGNCTITANVTVSAPGTYTNTIPAGSSAGGLNTSSGAAPSTNAQLTASGTADLAIQKTGPATVDQNGKVTYTIKVWNNGPSLASGATITDNVPSNLTGVTWSCARTGTASCGAASGNGNNISLTANLPGTSSATDYVTLTVTGTATTAGAITNTATVAVPSGVTETTPANNTSSASTSINPAVDLAASKTVDSTTIGQGGTLTYTVKVWNNGPSAVSGATFADTVPSNLTGVTWSCAASGSSSCGAVTSGNSNTISAVLGNLPGTGSGSDYVTYTIKGTASTTGSITNTATVTAPSGYNDTSAANNTAISPSTTIPPVADLAIQKTQSASVVAIGANETYTIKVWNNGPTAVTGASITDTVPAELGSITWTCAATGTATCGTASGSGNINLSGNLPVDANTTTGPDTNFITITVNARANSAGNITNTATVTAPAGVTEGNTANNSSSISADLGTQANLYINKTANKASYSIGDTVTYTITAYNNSPSGTNPKQLRIQDTVPSNLTNVTWSCAPYGAIANTYYDCDTTSDPGFYPTNASASGNGNTRPPAKVILEVLACGYRVRQSS